MEIVYHPASNKQINLPPTMSLLRAKLLLMLLFSYTELLISASAGKRTAVLLPLAVTAVSCCCC